MAEVRVRGAERVLEVAFVPTAAGPSGEERFRYPAEYLRVYSPAAAPHHHHEPAATASGPPLVVGRRHVGIINVRPVGNYAILIEFDDLHDTGIYSWDYLHHLGSHKYPLMKQYLRRLQAAGKSREPATRTRRPSRPPTTTTSAPAAPSPD